ncbi:MAG TPA: hypothetical protein VKB58_06520 [Terriglobales bacterium]|jgi:hypothetical protein|nr:hypothetical protein [Terriglobales bacterium]
MILSRCKSTFAVSLLAASLLSIPAYSQIHQTQPVLVTNGSGQPVPTVAQGTTNVSGSVSLSSGSTVNVGNFPSTQNVSGNVNVANFPATQNVGNTSTTPLFIDNDHAARVPYEQWCQGAIDVNDGSGQCSPLQTDDRAMVIDDITAEVSIPSGSQVFHMYITNSATGVLHFLTFVKAGTDGAGNEHFVCSSPVRFYVIPHATLTILMDTTGHAGSMIGSVSGHWVNP